MNKIISGLNWQDEPFESYLCVVYESTIHAMELCDDDNPDIEELLNKFFKIYLGSDCDFNLQVHNHSFDDNNCARIISDNRSCESVVIWAGCDFTLDIQDY